MKTWLRLTLITITVGGGFTGIVLTFLSLQAPQNRDFPNLEVLASFFALYCYVIGSGLVFVCDPQRTRPIMMALAAQIPRISSPVIAYKFCAGFEAFFDVKVAPPGLRLEGQFFFLGSQGHFAMLREAPWSAGVNIFALVMLVLLWRSVRESNSAVPEPTPATDQHEPANSEQVTALVAAGSEERAGESPEETPPDCDTPARNS